MASVRPVPTGSVHPWLGQLTFAFVDVDQAGARLSEPMGRLREAFESLGHVVQDEPTDETDVCLTAAHFGVPVDWRRALTVTVRRRFGLERTPAINTLMFATTAEFGALLDRYETALSRLEPVAEEFLLEGLAPSAVGTLLEQGKRGGPILSIERALQGQSKCIRLTLFVGDERPDSVFFFDLVGGYPQVVAGDDEEQFYVDIATRIATTAGAQEVTAHQVAPERITSATWDSLTAPAAMLRAGEQLGERHFFTDMVRVNDIVTVPAVDGAIASQYSEGCFATWDPKIEALVTTITGSARPVDKSALTFDDLAVLVGVRSDRLGAIVKHVEGLANIAPSSEAVELRDVDNGLPLVTLGSEWGQASGAQVPVIRSKLHGHRGIGAYNPERVEFVRLPDPYYGYPVSCATDAQAAGIKAAFATAESLRNPDDPRTIAFTIMPTHGIFITEKWVPGREPFEEILDAFDAGDLVVTPPIPQGDHHFEPAANGQMRLVDDHETAWPSLALSFGG